MSNETAIEREREKLGNKLQSMPGARDGSNEEANNIVDKIRAINIVLGRHPASVKKSSAPTFVKTYK